MNSAWLPHTILRTASLFAPGDQRAEWLREWHSELWYIPRCDAARFSLGAFRDAFWLRNNNASPARRTHLQSPLSCIAFLAVVAALCSLIAILLPAPSTMTPATHLNLRDVPAGCLVMLLLSCVLLPATRLAMGDARANRPPMPWRSRLRRGIFLALKMTLVQPAMLCAFLILVMFSKVPVAPQAFCITVWIMTFRWVLIDQERRCPVCLRLLTEPVRVGSASQTFLEWYGAELMCSRGHGLLHISDIAAKYCQKQRWLNLDNSWSDFFCEAEGRRQ